MSSKKLITVFGATGNQGRSIISLWSATADLRSNYAIRAITRNASTRKAEELRLAGCEVFEADMNDTGSLRRAVEGAWGVFSMTDFWQAGSKQAEFEQGKAIADATFDAGVKHLIWSSLPHTTRLSDGKLSEIDHYMGKAEVEEYIEAGKYPTIATYFMPGFFMANFDLFIRPGDNGLQFKAPFSGSVKVPLFAPNEDTGKYVFGILEAGFAADGLRVHGVSEWLSGEDFTDQLSRYADVGEVRFVRVTRDEFRDGQIMNVGQHLSEVLTQAMEFIGEFSYFEKDSEGIQDEHDKMLLKGSRKTTFREYTTKHNLLGGLKPLH
jgi:uncharacterized protein YbjT (DUF2867 family)